MAQTPTHERPNDTPSEDFEVLTSEPAESILSRLIDYKFGKHSDSVTHSTNTLGQAYEDLTLGHDLYLSREVSEDRKSGATHITYSKTKYPISPLGISISEGVRVKIERDGKPVYRDEVSLVGQHKAGETLSPLSTGFLIGRVLRSRSAKKA